MRNRSLPSPLVFLAIAVLSVACAPASPATPAPVTESTAAEMPTRLVTQIVETRQPVGEPEVFMYGPDAPTQEEADAYQKCGVRYDFGGRADYLSKLQSMIASGTPPDIFLVDTVSFPHFARQGILISLDDVPDGGWEDFGPLAEAFSWQGKRYGVPRDWQTLALFYNKELFDKAGWKYPDDGWTWNELEPAALMILKYTGVPGFAAPPTSIYFAPFVFQNGGTVLTEDFSDTRIDEPAAMDAGRFYVGLLRPGGPINPPDLGQPQVDAFGSGQVAMMLEGYWATRYLADKYPGLNYGVTQPPASPNQKWGEGTLLFADGYVVPEKASRPDHARKAVACLTSYDSQAQIPSSASVLPARRSVLEPRLADPVVRAFFDSLYSKSAQPYNWGSDIDSIISKALGRAYGEGVDVEESFKQAAEEIRKVLAR